MITDLTPYFDGVPPDVIYKLCVIIPSFVVAAPFVFSRTCVPHKSGDWPVPGPAQCRVQPRSEVIFKKSSNLYCRLDLGRVLMVGTKVSKGFFV